MIRERVVRSAVYLAVSRVLLQGLSFISTILIARWLNPEDYGLMALASVFMAALTLLSELGVGAAIIQFRDVDELELNTAFWLGLGTAALAYAVLYGAAPALAQFFANDRLTSVLRFAGIFAALSVLRVVPESLLRKRVRLDRLSVAEVFGMAVGTSLALGLAWGNAGVWALVAGNAGTRLVQCSLIFAFAGWRPGLIVGSRRTWKLMMFSGAALGSRLLWSVYSGSDRAVLGRVTSDVVLGFYAMGSQIALLPIEKITAMVNQLTGPVLAELQGDVVAMRRCVLRSLRIVAWSTLPLCVGTLLVAEDAIRLLLTEKWMPAVPVVKLLSLFAVVRSLVALFPPVLMANYRAGYLFAYNVALTVLLPLGFWIGAWWAGPLGVAAIWVLLYPIVASVMVTETIRYIDMPWRDLWLHLRRPVGATAVMAVATIAVDWALTSAGIGSGAVHLVAIVFTGVTVYGVLLWLTGGAVLQDFGLILSGLRIRPDVKTRSRGDTLASSASPPRE